MKKVLSLIVNLVALAMFTGSAVAQNEGEMAHSMKNKLDYTMLSEGCCTTWGEGNNCKQWTTPCPAGGGAERKRREEGRPAEPAERPAGAARAAGSPCDEWEIGSGTIFDPTQCDQLRSKGSLFVNHRFFTRPGTTSKWQIKTAADSNASLEGLEVVLISNNGNGTIVARSRTGKRGVFQVTIPRNASGKLRLQVQTTPSQQLRYFEYCYLQPDVNVLTPMCEDDPPLVVRFVK